MFEIPVKKKHIAGKGLYGYSRTHSGSGRKKPKGFGAGKSDPYNKREHVLVLLPSGKTRFYHGAKAVALLGT